MLGRIRRQLYEDREAFTRAVLPDRKEMVRAEAPLIDMHRWYVDSLDQCIVNACRSSWDKSYLAGTPDKDNCSDFVQSVATELGVPMPHGNASTMVGGLERSWTKLASGAEAARKAAQDFLVITGLKGRTYGHVAVVINGPLYRQKYPMCWCGSIADVVGQSQSPKSVDQVRDRTDRNRLNYYVCSLASCSLPGAS